MPAARRPGAGGQRGQRALLETLHQEALPQEGEPPPPTPEQVPGLESLGEVSSVGLEPLHGVTEE